MKCQKCKIEYPESKIEVSHDIPKYMGGTDKDGRHNLCRGCHTEYEAECLKLAMMSLIKILPEDQKKVCRNSAHIVKKYFFKEDKKDGL